MRLALLLLGAAGLVVALARPQWGIVREKVEREGVDVVLVLDTSGSMTTADVAPSRFFLARQALLQLVARLEGDRFALVAFEGEAYPLVPADPRRRRGRPLPRDGGAGDRARAGHVARASASRRGSTRSWTRSGGTR